MSYRCTAKPPELFTPYLARRGENRAPSPAGAAPIGGRRGWAIVIKPEWVPEWAWSEYQEYKRKLEKRASDTDTYISDWAKLVLSTGIEVLTHEGCASVWPIIERRAPDFSRRELCKASEPSNLYLARSQVESLLEMIAAAKKGPNWHDCIPRTERKRQGERIAKLASELRSELNALLIPEGGLPIKFQDAFWKLGMDVSDAYSDQFHNFDDEVDQSTKDRYWRERDLVLHGAVYAMIKSSAVKDNSRPALVAIEEGANAWSQTVPAIYRPGETGAARLYFVRRLSNYFKESYGTPLREATAALTRCLFDCDMDAVTVAKLAP